MRGSRLLRPYVHHDHLDPHSESEEATTQLFSHNCSLLSPGIDYSGMSIHSALKPKLMTILWYPFS